MTQMFGEHWFLMVLLIILWVLPWKAVALWMSARRGHKKWFAVFVIVNSVAIFPIIYIFFIGKKIQIEEVEK